MSAIEATTQLSSANMVPPEHRQHGNLEEQQQAAPKMEQTQSSKSADIAGTTCMELALEGERLCQSGDLTNGVKFFEEAIKVGTSDERTLSAIYSQLGNAYFYLEDYQKALDFHKQDVALVHSIGDEAAEAKACGNLGNTFKMLGKFDEAAVYCRRYLEISRKLKDEIGEGRALYNLGNVYHMQGKRMIGTSEQESGELPQDIRSSLQRAIEYYEANLKVVSKLKDSIAMGRAYGNLGNTHYLLGNFQDAVNSHKKRLELAKQTSDKSAERRAHLNLGNANVFLGNFQEAIENYSASLKLAQDLQDQHTEAHSCYSLANTYTFLRDYNSAIKYHLKYLKLIKELDDSLGEGRACWSLVNIYQMVGDQESALIYAKRHHEIAKLLNDKTGLASAKANIEELEETIAQKQAIKRMTIGACGNLSPINADSSESSTNATATTVREIRPDGGGENYDIDSCSNSNNNNNNTNSSANETTGRQSKTTSFELADDKQAMGSKNADNQSILARPKHHYHLQQKHQINRYLTADKRLEQEQRRFTKQLSRVLADVDGLAAARRRGLSSSAALGDDCRPGAASSASASGAPAGRGAGGGAGGGLHRSNSSEQLFDMIEHLQSGRIDDQRCEIIKRPIRQTTIATSTAAGMPLADNNNNNNKENNNEQAAFNSTPCSSGHATNSFAATITNPKSAVSAAASAIRATYRKASLAAYPVASQALQSIQQTQRRPTVSAEHRDQLFDLIAGAQRQRMDEQRASLPALQLPNGVLRGNRLAQARGAAAAAAMAAPLGGPQPLAQRESNLLSSSSSSSANSRQQKAPSEQKMQRDSSSSLGQGKIWSKERSRSIVPSMQNSNVLHETQAAASCSTANTTEMINANANHPNARAKIGKVNKHFQTIDSGDQVVAGSKHDEKFFDSLMRYQSTRFNDQRSEFPNRNNNSTMGKKVHEQMGVKVGQQESMTNTTTSAQGKENDFLNLIVKLGSDRIDDQRSAPPASMNREKNL